MRAMEISLSGLDVEWRRLELISENLANSDVAGTGKTGPYQAHYLITATKGDFAAHLNGKTQAGEIGLDALQGVAIEGIGVSATPPRMVHEPSNPLADANGNVAYPSIDHAEQMTLMIKTSQIYQANLVAMNAAREMYTKALEMGKRS